MADGGGTRHEIIGWHCHVYFTAETRQTAAELCEAVQDAFAIWDYRWLDKSNGLHPTPMFRFQFLTEDLSAFMHWITLHRNGLSVLLHAITGDDVFDHEYNAMWLGKPLTLDIEALRRFLERVRSGELPQSFLQEFQAQDKQAAGKVRYHPGEDPHAAHGG